MADVNPRSTAQIHGHPIHPMLVPFPIVFFVSTLFSDIVFWRTGDAGWAFASMWLLGAGIVGALAAAAAGLIDFLGEKRLRDSRYAWLHMAGNVTAVGIAVVNFIVRFTEGAAAGLLPWGVAMSLVVVLMLVVTGWLGGELVYRNRVGVADPSDTNRPVYR